MSANSEVATLTADPGCRYLAGLMDELKARVDECCGVDNDVKRSSSKEPLKDAASSKAAQDAIASNAAEELAQLREENKRLREELADMRTTVDNPQKASSTNTAG